MKHLSPANSPVNSIFIKMTSASATANRDSNLAYQNDGARDLILFAD